MARGHHFFGHRRRGYHHGALKDALIEAARHLIAEHGSGGFTLLDAARMASVSAAAPYRHFKDRQHLLGEVRARGFALFADRLEAAWRSEPDDRQAAFLAMGRAYIAFARDEPGYYGAMFASNLRRHDEATNADGTSDRAFQLLVDAATSWPGLPPGVNARLVAAHIWAMSHGVATLFVAMEHRLPVPPESILESAVRTYMRGLETAAPEPR